MKELPKIAAMLRKFAAERDWNKFHSPKNLSISLAVEAAELLEEFQWLTEKESCKLSQAQRSRVKDEIGDVLIYLVRLSDKLKIDPISAAKEKIIKNRKRYPVSKAKGNARKYTEFTN